MNREELLLKKDMWYKYKPVLFEIVKILKNRELAFISQKGEEPKRIVRYMIAFYVGMLEKHFGWMNFDKGLINIYHSVAKFKDGSIPMFSYDLKTRTKQQDYIDFNRDYAKYVEGYNFFLDMDGKEDFEKCYEETKEIKKIFDTYKIPYYMLNSSFKGFHIIIPEKYMPEIPLEKLIETIGNVIYNIKGIYGFESIDTSITDLKRVCKCPYSFVGDGSIALPLTDEQFENFNEDLVRPENVIRNIIIRDRGLLMRSHFCSDDELKKNVIKFLEDFK